MIVLRRKQFAWFNNWAAGLTGRSAAGRAAVNTQRKNYAAELMKGNSELSAAEAMKKANEQYKMTRDLTAGQQFGHLTKAVGNTALLAGGTAVGAGALGLGAVNSMGSNSFDALKGNMGSNSEGY